MQCSRCGTENNPNTRFCGNCGAQLIASAQSQPKSSIGNWLVIGSVVGVIGLLAVCGLCFLLVLISNSSSQNRTTTNAPSGSSNSTNPDSLTFEAIRDQARQLTEIKRNDYYKSLIGKSVHGSGKVADVSDNGDVEIRIVSPIGYDVILRGIPKATSASLNLKDSIDFDGTITNVDDLFGSGIPILTVMSK